MNPRIPIAVIGCGKLGSRHARIYREMQDVELVGVCDIDPERARALGAELGVMSHTSPEPFFARIRAASICTPAVTHHEVALRFLEAGIHLLIEKPITTEIAQADEILRLAVRKNVLLQTGHVERFNAGVRTMKEIVRNPLFIECDRIGPFEGRITDVGVVLDLMIHDIDIVLFLVSSRIRSINTVGHRMLSPTEDFANARIVFENGAVCDLTASRMARDKLRKIRVFERNAYISLDYSRQEALILSRRNGGARYQTIEIKKSDALRDELRHFIACVRANQRPSISGEEGRAALEVALEIQNQIRRRIDISVPS